MPLPEHVDPQIRASTESLHAAEVLLRSVAAGDEPDDYRNDRYGAQEDVPQCFGGEFQMKHQQLHHQAHSRVVMRGRRIGFGSFLVIVHAAESRFGSDASQCALPLAIVARMRSFRLRLIIAVALLCGARAADVSAQTGIVVLQTDFGLKDQAVAAMHGVVRKVDRNLVVDDLTHEIPAYDIWQAAYRLDAVVDYWPSDTVFVSVIDPGVGTSRKSVVARLKSGELVVSPDNGTLTLVGDRIGVDAVREIDESRHRLPGSEDSYTFHGRDVYSYVGALLASKQVAFDDVGPLRDGIVSIPHEKARREGGSLIGGIPVLDPQFGNVWTNIPSSMIAELGIRAGDQVLLTITQGGAPKLTLTLPFAHTFGDVPIGRPLLYANSVGMLAAALNQSDFAASYHIASGPDWRITVTAAKAERP